MSPKYLAAQLMWWRKAAEQGNAWAQHNLEVFFTTSIEPLRAKRFF